MLRSAWLIRFIEHRVADTRVVRLIKKWLHAGVLEDGRLTRSEVETIQGGSISPLLSNIYLHYAFNLWVKQWRVRHAVGDMRDVRYADDWVDTDFFLPVAVQIGHMLVLAGHAARAGRLFAGFDAVAALSVHQRHAGQHGHGVHRCRHVVKAARRRKPVGGFAVDQRTVGQAQRERRALQAIDAQRLVVECHMHRTPGVGARDACNLVVDVLFPYRLLLEVLRRRENPDRQVSDACDRLHRGFVE
ncbi:hypothetical protein WJ96_27955 [Burkholderia ubonensis]|uniref:Reverse transcriptase domain-containing protein n=1 Tax=Burkholderia ubonensis TaxID=101571 RepID=A0AAW3MJY2_9BURK|nr:hypothetical protein WJ96_27955 [Burkholderia ubonensis]KVZ87644.1 hypothetical protein WL25_28725 [Burkholderia ubonensis]